MNISLSTRPGAPVPGSVKGLSCFDSLGADLAAAWDRLVLVRPSRSGDEWYGTLVGN